MWSCTNCYSKTIQPPSIVGRFVDSVTCKDGASSCGYQEMSEGPPVNTAEAETKAWLLGLWLVLSVASAWKTKLKGNAEETSEMLNYSLIHCKPPSPGKTHCVHPPPPHPNPPVLFFHQPHSSLVLGLLGHLIPFVGWGLKGLKSSPNTELHVQCRQCTQLVPFHHTHSKHIQTQL